MKRLAPSLIAAFALAASAVMGAGPAPAHAQQEAPNLVSVGVLKAAPAHSDQLGELIGKVAEAAKMSNLSSKHSWSVYQTGNEYHIVSWPENWAQLDDQGAMWREIGAGAGAEMMQEAMDAYGELWVTSESFMANHIEDWSYMPEDGLQPGEHTGAVMYQNWIMPGKGEEFAESTRGIMAMLAEMNYPYPVFGHRVIMGDENLAAFVLLHDGLGNFYGEKDFEKIIEAAGTGEKWSSHMDARGEFVYETEMELMEWREDLSYLPESE